jgi:tRNA (adenine57-N1/adenine58-N1)-methyltransferase catalytic subunit
MNRRGPFVAGDQVQLTDPKGRMHQIVLQPGGTFHTHRGALSHDDLIGAPEGSVVIAAGGTAYVALRPLLADFTLAMKRGAAIIYPKDAASILAYADIFPGARVLEAGAGSGALSAWMLRAIGPEGRLVSFERRPDFAEIARANVTRYFGAPPAWWTLVTADLSAKAAVELMRDGPSLRATHPTLLRVAEATAGSSQGQAPAGEMFDRVILDMLSPWDCVADVATALIPGGLLCCYVATTTQLSRVTEEIRLHGGFFEPAAWETLMRGWHLDGLAVRPEHRMIGHTAFLVTARRLAEGVSAPARRRRPSKGAHVEESPGSPASPDDLLPGLRGDRLAVSSGDPDSWEESL